MIGSRRSLTLIPTERKRIPVCPLDPRRRDRAPMLLSRAPGSLFPENPPHGRHP